jgi:hypothetical protein
MDRRDQAEEQSYLRDVTEKREKRDKDQAALEQAVKDKMAQPPASLPGHAR